MVNRVKRRYWRRFNFTGRTLGYNTLKLGRGDYHYTTGEMAGYAEPTVSCLIKEVCQAIVEIL